MIFTTCYFQTLEIQRYRRKANLSLPICSKTITCMFLYVKFVCIYSKHITHIFGFIPSTSFFDNICKLLCISLWSQWSITSVSSYTSSFVHLSSFFYLDLSLSLLSLRSTHPEVYLGKGVLKICSEFTGEDLCRSVIAIKLLCNFIEITLRQLVSPFNLLHIFRALFPKDTSGRLLLKSDCGITFTP